MKKIIRPEPSSRVVACYALIDVYVGEAKTEARPTGWDQPDFTGQGKTKDGKDIWSTRFSSTCPTCGSLLNFTVDDIVVVGSKNYIPCVKCKKTTPQLPTFEPISAELPNKPTSKPIAKPTINNQRHDEWQELPKNAGPIEPGQEIRLDMETGQRFVKNKKKSVIDPISSGAMTIKEILDDLEE